MKVLFVCTANTCRSPMLEYIFKAYLKMKGNSDVEVSSAGLVLSNDTLNPMCLKTLDRHGVPYFDRMAQFCTKAICSKANFVFTMTEHQAQVLRDVYGKKKNVYCLADICNQEIFDPYGLGEDAYESVYKIFWNNVDKIYDIVCKTSV